jgi:hypothetical protein
MHVVVSLLLVVVVVSPTPFVSFVFLQSFLLIDENLPLSLPTPSDTIQSNASVVLANSISSLVIKWFCPKNPYS